MRNMNGCKADATKATMAIFNSAGTLVDSIATADNDLETYHSDAMPADTYTMWVKLTWGSDDVKDYTLRTYAPSLIKITQTAKGIDAYAELALKSAMTILPTLEAKSYTGYKQRTANV